MDGEALQQKTTDQKGENSQLQDIQGQKGGRECLWNTSGQIQGPTDHHGTKARGCEEHCVNMGGTTQHAKKTSGWSRQAKLPADDIQLPQADQAANGPMTILENHLGQTSTRPTERLLQKSRGTGWAGGKDLLSVTMCFGL